MINISAIIQIAILYFVILAILKGAKGSRFGQALTGAGIIAAAMIAFTYVFQFDVLSTIVRSLLVYLAISTVVIFQPEIRRILSQLGALGYVEKPKYSSGGAATADYVTETIISLAEAKIGALIAIERGISLRGYEDTGVRLDAIFSKELATAVFTPPLPLHDGGMTLRNGRVSAAHCVFPVSNNPSLCTSGMRHRAAVGLSEETDALVVAVSEETGDISVAYNGKITRYHAGQCRAQLLRWISKAMPDGRSRRNGIISKIYDRFAKGLKQK